MIYHTSDIEERSFALVSGPVRQLRARLRGQHVSRYARVGIFPTEVFRPEDSRTDAAALRQRR